MEAGLWGNGGWSYASSAGSSSAGGGRQRCMEYQGAAQYTHQQLGSAGQSAILYSDYAVEN